jgi:DNA-binding transcriptional regulator LsrR (DeoR family)
MTLQKPQHEIDYCRALLTYLISQGLNYQQAAEKLPEHFGKLAPATITRYVDTAKKRRWLVTRFGEEQFPPKVLDDIREDANHIPWIDLEENLRMLSGGVLKKLWVFESGDEVNPGKDQAEWDWQMGNFARNSAWLVLQLLLSSQSGIALGWGKTIANSILEVAERIKSEKKVKPRRRKKITIIPTVGTPPSTTPDDLATSSTKLARTLSEAINGTWNVLSLDNIWPVSPPGLEGERRLGFFQANLIKGNYKAIFGDPDGFDSETPLIRTVDTILTSAGAFHVESYYMKELVETGKVTKEELIKLSIGDIGGVLIPSKAVESNPINKTRFDGILSLWTGPKLEDYQNVARQAAANDALHAPAGVILCALNGNKANIVLNLVRLQAVSVLVVDCHLANSLQRLLIESKK